jgi:hypothetical protein
MIVSFALLLPGEADLANDHAAHSRSQCLAEPEIRADGQAEGRELRKGHAAPVSRHLLCQRQLQPGQKEWQSLPHVPDHDLQAREPVECPRSSSARGSGDPVSVTERCLLRGHCQDLRHLHSFISRVALESPPITAWRLQHGWSDRDPVTTPLLRRLRRTARAAR